MTVSATASARLATTPATAMVAAWRWSRARSTASSHNGRRCGRTRASSAATPAGTQTMPPSSRHATDAYAAHGRPPIGGASASSAPSASNAGPVHGGSVACAPLPRPFNACAGAIARADHAGCQAPHSAATTPSAPYSSAASGSKRSCGATPGSRPDPRSPPRKRSAADASAVPSATPSALPTTPTSAASTSTSRCRSRAVRPSTPSSASCGKRCATASDSTENTRKPPTNSATSASTVRLTRYARDRFDTRCSDSSGLAARTPCGKASPRSTASRSAPARRRTSMRERRPSRSKCFCAPAMSMTAIGTPSAATLPAMRSVTRALPNANTACVLALPSRSRSAALMNTTSGSMARRASESTSGRGSSAGVTAAATSASMPSTVTGTRAPSPAKASVCSSTTGLASATCGCVATRAYSASGKPSRGPRSSRSGCPLTERTAAPNSASADELMR